MGKRIHVAEDEPSIATSLTFLLERAGYEVSVSSDGPATLDAVLSNNPDALILDVMLPGMDGYEVLRRLREDARSATLPILVLTAKGQTEDRQIAKDMGANLFVTKPFANADILNAVASLIDDAS